MNIFNVKTRFLVLIDLAVLVVFFAGILTMRNCGVDVPCIASAQYWLKIIFPRILIVLAIIYNIAVVIASRKS